MGNSCCAQDSVPPKESTAVAHTPIEYGKEQTDSAIKIQSHYRGHKTRAEFQKDNKVGTNGTEEPGKMDEQKNLQHLPPVSTAKKIEQIPNTLNPVTSKILEKYGPFKYENDEQEDLDLPQGGPYELENGAIYIGQWKIGQRHGKGKQYWTDGSFYEGYWKTGMANGKGRLIHADGDIYNGD